MIQQTYQFQHTLCSKTSIQTMCTVNDVEMRDVTPSKQTGHFCYHDITVKK